MKVTIDQPTDHEWVITDPVALCHYYAQLLPAGKGHQLVIAVLGPHKDKYELLTEVYSCHFYDRHPQRFASLLVRMFSSCRDRDFPIELVYDFGGVVAAETVYIPSLDLKVLQ